jgi:hypothetical protein
MVGARLRGAAATWGIACGAPATLDADQDGVPDYEDCAPHDARRFPGNAEVCDGTDNDCDRTADEDLVQTWFVDVDGDGHGDPARGVDTCAPDQGRVTLGDDCDDVQADVFPGAVERCDDKDNDCVGGMDDARWSTRFDAGWNTGTAALTGDASVLTDPNDTDPYLRLMRAQPNLQGGLWFLPRVPGERWRLRFRVRFSGAGGLPGEGLALAFVSTDLAPVTGGPGAQLGLYGADVDGWALEIVAAKPVPDSPTPWEPRLAFRTIRDEALIAERSGSPRMDPGVWHQVEYVQDGPAFDLRVDGTRVWNGTVLVSTGPYVTVGFSAATSRARQLQVALDDVELACPDTPDAPAPADTGSPSSAPSALAAGGS